MTQRIFFSVPLGAFRPIPRILLLVSRLDRGRGCCCTTSTTNLTSAMWPFSSGRASETAPAAPAAPPAAPAGGVSSGEYSPQATLTVDAAQAPSAADILGGGNYALDLTKMYPMAGLGKDDLEFLDIVDDAPSTLDPTALPSRGWSDNLSYGTGTAFLGGQLLGAVLGIREGLTRPLGVEHPTARLRLNAVLNAVSRRGSFLGNSGGVLGMSSPSSSSSSLLQQSPGSALTSY